MLSPYDQGVRITHIFLHSQYNDVGFVNDVSLLQLEQEALILCDLSSLLVVILRFEMAESAPLLAGDSSLKLAGFSVSLLCNNLI